MNAPKSDCLFGHSLRPTYLHIFFMLPLFKLYILGSHKNHSTPSLVYQCWSLTILGFFALLIHGCMRLVFYAKSMQCSQSKCGDPGRDKISHTTTTTPTHLNITTNSTQMFMKHISFPSYLYDYDTTPTV